MPTCKSSPKRFNPYPEPDFSLLFGLYFEEIPNVFVVMLSGARLALEKAEKSRRYYVLEAEAPVYLLDDLLLLLGYIKTRWSDEMVFRRYFLYQTQKTSKNVARSERVSKEAVNKFIKKYGFREVLLITRDFHRGIQDLFS